MQCPDEERIEWICLKFEGLIIRHDYNAWLKGDMTLLSRLFSTSHCLEIVSFPQLSRKKLLCSAAILGLIVLLTGLVVRINFKGHYEGVFLLKGSGRYLFELKDDLYLGDEHRLIYGLDFDDPLYRIAHLFDRNRHEAPYLAYEWNTKDGEGYIRNYLPDGRQLVTNFSRFTDDLGKEAAGLIVGGGMPDSVMEDNHTRMSETGMSYFNGKRWFHIWCNANEAVLSAQTLKPVYPSQWKFLGSKVLNASEKVLTLMSSHQITIDNVPLRMDRVAFFKAGEPYFILSVRIQNMGKQFASYSYMYGDEPWLGNFGSSEGNVGWTKDGLVKQVGSIDTNKHTFAGMFDYGNDLIGEGHDYTMMANFMEWRSDPNPGAYFSNSPFDKFDPATHTPLNSNGRFIGLQWWGDLKPGETERYYIAIGMAGLDPKTGLPAKPEVDWKME